MAEGKRHTARRSVMEHATAHHAVPPPAASQDGWCVRHQVAMERRNNAKGTWWSHWLADENRWCRGK